MIGSTLTGILFAENESESEKKSRRILCLDHDQKVIEELTNTLNANGFEVIPAHSLGEAVEKLTVYDPQVIITELLFDSVKPLQLLKTLKLIRKDAALIIYTEQQERRIGNNRRLNHVFEFISKPSSANEILAHVKRAFTFYKHRQELELFIEESRMRVKQQLEWLIWMERNVIADRVAFSKSMVNSIKHAVTQGNGLSALITYSEMLQLSQKPSGHNDEVIVSKKMVEGLLDSAQCARMWIEEMDQLSKNLSRKYELEDIPPETVQITIERVILDLEPFRIIKNQNIECDPYPFHETLTANIKVLEIAFKETLMNALKFSPEESIIRIKFHRSGNSVSMKVSNVIMLSSGTGEGVPAFFEQKVFEPFFRMNNIHDERYHGEFFGMGTGLTILQGAINQVGGKIYVYESSESTESRRVIAEIIFPAEEKLVSP